MNVIPNCIFITQSLSFSKWYRDEQITSEGGAREIIDLEAHQRFLRLNFELQR
jgi:hypothetical protein